MAPGEHLAAFAVAAALVGGAGLVGLAGCVSERDRPGAAACPTWIEDVGPQLDARCATCHSGADAAAGVRVDDYGALVATAAIAGDAEAPLVTALAPATADAVHAPFVDLYPAVRRWVVDCAVPYRRSALHGGGILDPRSAEFHGAELARRDWDFALCTTCHGDDLGGGAAGVACVACHDDSPAGPTGCTTCHDAAPSSAAHVAHRPFGCATCHDVPARWDAPGHILVGGAGGTRDDAPAEVVLGGLAATTLDAAGRDGAPAYDPATGSCANVYCHGDALTGAGATLTEPMWRGGATQAACGTCHGEPPASHARTDCATCHPADAGHIDGALAVGRTAGCDGCHGSGARGGPPADLAGNTSTDAIGVGAHQAHLTGPRRIAGAMSCETCHQTPTTVTAAGHLDSAAPAEVVASAGWDATAGQCGNACHGPSRPRWTGGADEVTCGACHGVPPSSHDPELSLRDCATCHPRTIDSDGAILRTGPPGAERSEHLDGDVDVDL